MTYQRNNPDIVLSIAVALVLMLVFVVAVGGCTAKGKTTPTKPAVHQAIENVKDADDLLVSAEKHLRKDPPAVPAAQTDIAGARDQLTYAQGDLKAAAKSTSVNDEKARKWDEVQDDWISPRMWSWMWIIGIITGLGIFLKIGGLAIVGPAGVVLSRIGSFLLAIGTMGLTGIQWVFEEAWEWISSRKAKVSEGGAK